MKKEMIRTGLWAGLSLLLACGGCSKDEDGESGGAGNVKGVEVTVTPDRESILRNPFSGWVLYAGLGDGLANDYWEQYDRLECPSVPEGYVKVSDYASMLLIRIRWADANPERDVYIWDEGVDTKQAQRLRLLKPPQPTIAYAVGRVTERELDRVLAARPTALVVCGESVALQAACGLRKRGLRIPEDISLITSELEDICRWLTPELTTINQDLDALAAKTVSLLLARIREPDSPREDIRLPSSLIVRSSVRNLNA